MKTLNKDLYYYRKGDFESPFIVNYSAEAKRWFVINQFQLIYVHPTDVKILEKKGIFE